MAHLRPYESREHLLSARSSLAPSSRASSIYSTDSIDTVLVSGNPSGQPTEPQSYRGFPSREAYLAALRDWAESKQFLESDYQIRGFYGQKTMDYYKNKPGLRDARKARKASEAIARQQAARRATVANNIPEPVSEDGESLSNAVTADTITTDPGNVSEAAAKESKVRRLSRVFTGGRRATVG